MNKNCSIRRKPPIMKTSSTQMMKKIFMSGIVNSVYSCFSSEWKIRDAFYIFNEIIFHQKKYLL